MDKYLILALIEPIVINRFHCKLHGKCQWTPHSKHNALTALSTSSWSCTFQPPLSWLFHWFSSLSLSLPTISINCPTSEGTEEQLKMICISCCSHGSHVDFSAVFLWSCNALIYFSLALLAKHIIGILLFVLTGLVFPRHKHPFPVEDRIT